MNKLDRHVGKNFMIFALLTVSAYAEDSTFPSENAPMQDVEENQKIKTLVDKLNALGLISENPEKAKELDDLHESISSRRRPGHARKSLAELAYERMQALEKFKSPKPFITKAAPRLTREELKAMFEESNELKKRPNGGIAKRPGVGEQEMTFEQFVDNYQFQRKRLAKAESQYNNSKISPKLRKKIQNEKALAINDLVQGFINQCVEEKCNCSDPKVKESCFKGDVICCRKDKKTEGSYLEGMLDRIVKNKNGPLEHCQKDGNLIICEGDGTYLKQLNDAERIKSFLVNQEEGKNISRIPSSFGEEPVPEGIPEGSGALEN